MSSKAGTRTKLLLAFGTIPVKVVYVGVGKQVILRLTQSSRAGTRTELGNNLPLRHNLSFKSKLKIQIIFELS